MSDRLKHSVGSPDMFCDGAAGAYRVLTHLHPEQIHAGEMEIRVHTDSMAATHQIPHGAEVSLPYAFPSSGPYRIFVQMKRAKIQTGAFDVGI
jgi:hypothetical protein